MDVHKLWADNKNDTEFRLSLGKALAACDFNKKTFSKRVLKHWLYSDRTEHVVESGWYSDEQMSTELGYSKYAVLN